MRIDYELPDKQEVEKLRMLGLCDRMIAYLHNKYGIEMKGGA